MISARSLSKGVKGVRGPMDKAAAKSCADQRRIRLVWNETTKGIGAIRGSELLLAAFFGVQRILRSQPIGFPREGFIQKVPGLWQKSRCEIT